MISKEEVATALIEIGVLDNQDNDKTFVIKVPDSITYINTIISLEEYFNIVFDDEYLIGSLFNSLENLTETINRIVDSSSS